MKTTRRPLMIALSLAAALALGGCGKKDESAAQIPATPPPEATAPATMPTTLAPTAEPATAAISFTSMQLGSKVDENNKVVLSGDSFAPTDSIYASVASGGSGSGTLAAKWTYQDGQTVHEDSKRLDTSGPETTVFMISKPSGFPAGNYKVAISLNGNQVATQDFSIH